MNKNTMEGKKPLSASEKKPEDIKNILRSDKPLPIEESITGLLKSYGLDDILLFSKIKKHWSFILTEPLCEKIKPLRIKNGNLYVTADDPAYGNALMYQKHTILSYIRVTIQNPGVSNLVFVPTKSNDK